MRILALLSTVVVSPASAQERIVWELVSTEIVCPPAICRSGPESGVLTGCVNDACSGTISDGAFSLSFNNAQNEQEFGVTFDSAPGIVDPANPPTLFSSGSASGSGPTPYRVTFCYRIDDVAPDASDQATECSEFGNNLADAGQSDSGEYRFAPRTPNAPGDVLELYARVNFWAAVKYTYWASLADDLPRCDGRIATLVAGDGNTGYKLVGTEGDDVIVGSPYLDFIEGRGGDDTICGGDGDDIIKGGPGNDRLFGEEGTDRIRGGRGHDVIRTGPGGIGTFSSANQPQIGDGGAGRDVVVGQGECDYLNGGRNRDLLILTKQSPSGCIGKIFGGPGDDILRGSADLDLLCGGRGDDSIKGRRGADEICGGSGNDDLFGGPNTDSCDMDPEDLSPPTCEVLSEFACEFCARRSR